MHGAFVASTLAAAYVPVANFDHLVKNEVGRSEKNLEAVYLDPKSMQNTGNLCCFCSSWPTFFIYFWGSKYLRYMILYSHIRQMGQEYFWAQAYHSRGLYSRLDVQAPSWAHASPRSPYPQLPKPPFLKAPHNSTSLYIHMYIYIYIDFKEESTTMVVLVLVADGSPKYVQT